MGKKLKPILPTLKEKKRYLAFEFITDEMLDEKDIRKSIDDACLSFLGELGFAKSGIQIIECINNKGLIKVNNRYVDELRSSLIFIKDIKGHDVTFNTLGVSGIIQKAKEKYLQP